MLIIVNKTIINTVFILANVFYIIQNKYKIHIPNLGGDDNIRINTHIFTVLLTVAIAFLLIGAVSANETNDTVADSIDDSQVAMPQTDLDASAGDAHTFSELSNEIGHGGNITLKHDYYAYDSGSTISITENNTVIEGNGAVIDMMWAEIRPFTVSACGVTIKNLTIKKVYTTDDGGAIYFTNPGTVLSCNFEDNSAYSGGALYFGQSGRIADCSFKGNLANYDAGAVKMNSGTIENCRFSDNSAYLGGAVEINSGTIENSTFNDNSASADCGAIKMNSGTVKNCNFEINFARLGIGCVYVVSGIVENCTFTENSAGRAGAARIDSGIIENCSFEANTADDAGAVIMTSGTLKGCRFSHNSAEWGGAVMAYECNITGCLFDENAGEMGGAVYFFEDGKIENSNFTANRASSEGGAVFFDKNGSTTNCRFQDNVADSYAGAILFSANGSAVNCTFTSNKAADGAGGAVFFGANATAENCTFKSNKATRKGGAIYCDYSASIKDSKFTGDSALCGGAVYLEWGTLSLVENCSFTGCSAEDSGGAIKSRQNASVVNCSFTDCRFPYGSRDYDSTWSRFEVKVYDGYYVYGEQEFISFLVPDDIENEVVALIDGKAYECYGPMDPSSPSPWVWGEAEYKAGYYVRFSNLTLGDHTLVISYPGDSIYGPHNFTKTITVHENSPKIVASNIKAIYSAGSYYTIKVYDVYGEPADGVPVKISGKISKTLKTDRGVAKFRIDQVPGTYRITISSLGKSIQRTLTVKHIVTLKIVKVKKSAKKLTLQASLAKVNGKYLKNKKITFKFNGKKYAAKTNKKGVAKYTIKSSVLKKLNAGKKVTYQATYLKDTVKKTAKVKK